MKALPAARVLAGILACVAPARAAPAATAPASQAPAQPDGASYAAALTSAERLWTVAEARSAERKRIGKADRTSEKLREASRAESLAWRRAAEQYTRVADMNPSGVRARKAARKAMLAWQSCLEVSEEPEPARERDREAQGRRSAPPDIPPDQAAMIAAFDRYLRYAPEDEAATIKYRKARVFYEWGHFAEAAPLFQEVFEQHPEHELAVYSANLMIDALVADGRMAEVDSWWLDKFPRMPGLMKDPEFARLTRQMKSDFETLRAQKHEREKR